jgi:hypothetical protein
MSRSETVRHQRPLAQLRDPLKYEAFISSIRSRQPVAGLTHDFYRYPACFAPAFARAAIELFTDVGDTVYDPFMGGATALVEACVLGRKAVGTDISELALFIARTKTTVLSDEDLAHVERWTRRLPDRLHLHNPPVRATEWMRLGYQNNISGRTTWPIRKSIELALDYVNDLPSGRLQAFARCVILRTARWALDCRRYIPSAAEFRQEMLENFRRLGQGAGEFAQALRQAGHPAKPDDQPLTFCYHRPAAGVEEDPAILEHCPPRLILTSPPYPGVHVLYHRWQVQGRREAPAPFWIADSLDGQGASFYTFGDRREQGLVKYFDLALASFTSLARISGPDTLLVQMVAFADPDSHLPRYLDVLEQAGFEEAPWEPPPGVAMDRPWREVPNRRWYARNRGTIPASREVVLIHRRR